MYTAVKTHALTCRRQFNTVAASQHKRSCGALCLELLQSTPEAGRCAILSSSRDWLRRQTPRWNAAPAVLSWLTPSVTKHSSRAADRQLSLVASRSVSSSRLVPSRRRYTCSTFTEWRGRLHPLAPSLQSRGERKRLSSRDLWQQYLKKVYERLLQLWLMSAEARSACGTWHNQHVLVVSWS